MPRPYISTAVRRLVIERAHGQCEYCQCPVAYATQSFNVDHIIPLSQGGSSQLDNLALACSGCNGFKHQRSHGIDPVTYQPARLFHPRQDRWTDHFDWDEDFARIIGKTEIGRATIESLQMNRAGVVNLRALLHQAGKHPPE